MRCVTCTTRELASDSGHEPEMCACRPPTSGDSDRPTPPILVTVVRTVLQAPSRTLDETRDELTEERVVQSTAEEVADESGLFD